MASRRRRRPARTSRAADAVRPSPLQLPQQLVVAVAVVVAADAAV